MALPAGHAAWADDVLAFWFGELPKAAWFRVDPAADTLIRERFLDLTERLAAGPLVAADGTPHTALAAVIALDQFPRNMFRGTPRAFATDPQALMQAKAAVAAGLDRTMTADERLFLYLPFEHSESSIDQARAIALIGALGVAEYTRFALAHQAIIDRFGRFPHRNAILGRPSTADEIAFLAGPDSSF